METFLCSRSGFMFHHEGPVGRAICEACKNLKKNANNDRASCARNLPHIDCKRCGGSNRLDELHFVEPSIKRRGQEQSIVAYCGQGRCYNELRVYSKKNNPAKKIMIKRKG